MTTQRAAIIKAIDDVPEVAVERTRGATIQVLIGAGDGAPRFATRRFTLAPGARIGTHRHANVEHEQVVLEGEIVFGLDERQEVLQAGMAVYIPPGVAHWYENRSDKPARFLCVVPTTIPYETEWLEDGSETG